MKKRSDYEGLEFDWFAIDSDGFIALMSSAGFGPIPDYVFARFEEQRRIEEHLSNLIRVTTSNDLKRVMQLLSAFGVFAYDWRHWDGPYRRFDIPTRAQRLDEFGPLSELRDAFVIVPACFCISAELHSELLVPCNG